MEGGIPSQQQMQDQQAKAAAQEEQRKEILQKLLTPEAADRLARIALVKPDKVCTNCFAKNSSAAARVYIRPVVPCIVLWAARVQCASLHPIPPSPRRAAPLLAPEGGRNPKSHSLACLFITRLVALRLGRARTWSS